MNHAGIRGEGSCRNIMGGGGGGGKMGTYEVGRGGGADADLYLLGMAQYTPKLG